ncbi:hypothetical protein CAOG_06869 [Capsaspora owczarzaki ATCC 30864]|uniref:Transmembrane protein n=1 Tax=Capsaspora owczarzaki (strain ATCC 30864) TaxID=595528 RepID=A0A0D2VY19_CAPO3|nr:hypothetical protein CAOG_06869 [Capsaspora owczarzaki ATCC 30864]KJE96567.1 hypothetical protein CAOG_006869 [Capsaspora owczarzaki ATCC 30864]|eukprot:XP_004344490.1 hypothetical protein CAOG_06869 [Capsaspora owczarzaki ATCC 30864]
MEYAAPALYWFAVAGAGGACLKHWLTPETMLRELTPVAFRGGATLSPEGRWWGSYAAGAMNLGIFVNGVWVGLYGDRVARQGHLLGTAALFAGFAAAWATQGHTTGMKNHRAQAVKVTCIGALILTGFLLQ